MLLFKNKKLNSTDDLSHNFFEYYKLILILHPKKTAPLSRMYVELYVPSIESNVQVGPPITLIIANISVLKYELFPQ